jgi:hypothetical protein
MKPMYKLLMRRPIVSIAGAAGTFGKLEKPRRTIKTSISKADSYHLKRCCYERRVGTSPGVLLILLVFSGRAFAIHESFGPYHQWTEGPYYGTRGTFFADVTGDGAADAIVVDYNTVTGTTHTTGKGTGEVYGKAAAEFSAAWNDLPKITNERRSR